MEIRVIILLFSLGMVYSCNTTKQTTSSQEPVDQKPMIIAGGFVVNTLYGKSVEGNDLSLKINDRTSEISGFAGCNTYSTIFTNSDNILSFSTITATERYCEESIMEKEREFLKIFSSSKEVTIKNDMLFLYKDGKEILKATRFIL